MRRAISSLVDFLVPEISRPQTAIKTTAISRPKNSQFLLGPGSTIVTKKAAPTEIRTTTVSYCVIVDILNEDSDERFLHHFTGIGFNGELHGENVRKFKDDLTNFLQRCGDKKPDLVIMHRVLGWKDVEHFHLSDKGDSPYRQKNSGLLESILEKIAKKEGWNFSFKDELHFGEFKSINLTTATILE